MEYAIDLSTRQSARTLEQAVRYRATVLIEPGLWPDADGLKGRLIALDAESLRAELTEPSVFRPSHMVGSYCDVSLLLGQDRFLFSTHALDAKQAGERWSVSLARPEKLRVYQRRRFWRVKLAESARVRLRRDADNAGTEIVGWLCNISGEGMACLVEADAAERLHVGETIAASFALPDAGPPFDLHAVLCNKTPNAENEKMILGMQFLPSASSRTTNAARRLSEFLLRRYGSGVAPLGNGTRVADGVVS